MIHRNTALACKLSLVGLSLFVSAQGVADQSGESESRDNQGDGPSFMVGAMVASSHSIYVDGDDGTDMMPFFSAQWGRYFIEGPSVGAHLFEYNDWSASASINFDGLGDDDRDGSSTLSDMEKFDSVISSSISLGYAHEWGEYAFSLTSDISGAHNGLTAEFGYSYPFELGDWMISPEAKVEWMSKDINQYYYGVSAADAKQHRPVYNADAGFNYELGMTAMYPFWERHAVMLQASYKVYSSEVTDSPIVDEDGVASIGIGYIYRF